ncbi:biotin--[acetyl-CoA-carboxylase] ligase [Nocardioides fonticola]|uniref:biotin--[biotin carboxyl-carrier protein] ligase n=1 Tax=Nocardioides fonticola TaxID=450363 RepID=A0ABP7XEY7_9ACTN
MPVDPEPDARPSFGVPTPPTPLDPLDAEVLGGLDIEVLATATSTNAVLAARARAGESGASAVVAEHQTRGRGRLDRSWEAPAGRALTFSVLLRPEVAPSRWPWLPLLTGCVVADVLRTHGYGAAVKWPNDVLLPTVAGGRPEAKVAGILLERVETPAGPAAVVGIGLNVHLSAEELPVPTATSLALARSSAPPSRTALLAALVEALRARHARWAAEAPDVLRREYVEGCVTLGRDVRVELPSAPPLRGRAVGIDAEGRLEVRGPDGVVAVGVGDVVHVRPDGQVAEKADGEAAEGTAGPPGARPGAPEPPEVG